MAHDTEWEQSRNTKKGVGIMGSKKFYCALIFIIASVCYGGTLTDSTTFTKGIYSPNARILKAKIDSLKGHCNIDTITGKVTTVQDSAKSSHKADTLVGKLLDTMHITKLRVNHSIEDTNEIRDVLILDEHPVGTYATEGAVYYDSTHEDLRAYTNHMGGTVNRTIWASSSVTLDSNNAAEVELKGTDSSFTDPVLGDSLSANFFRLGKKLEYTLRGIYSSKGGGVGTLTIKIYLNNTVVDSTVAYTPNSSISNGAWVLQSSISCGSVTGTATSIRSYAQYQAAGTSNTPDFISMYIPGVTINTTIKQRFHVTAKWATADVANKITCGQFTLKEIH